MHLYKILKHRMCTPAYSNEGGKYIANTINNKEKSYNKRNYTTKDSGIGARAETDKNNNKQLEINNQKYSSATVSALATENLSPSKHTSTTMSGQTGAHASASATIQLTPLWEHILRTRKIPESINIAAMFHEFHERLRDPEWQVRQHALRVLVDVLVVMRAKADSYMSPLIAEIVENLGHPAPTVRKGALDCLRVYLAETAIPEKIMMQILDIGLNQKITNEPFGGRLTCGVMLSLPALVQSTLHTAQRHYILRCTIDMLVKKMGQVTHQEITLKVLLKLLDLLGDAEFEKYMSHGAFREFELLCNVYGLNDVEVRNENCKRMSSAGSANWQPNTINQSAALSWQSSAMISENEAEILACPEHAKVIMETEIKINDDTVTMRILEAKDDASFQRNAGTVPSLDDEVVCGHMTNTQNDHNPEGIINMLSDSDLDVNTTADEGVETKREKYFSIVTPSTPSRTPKRVTFGGEVVKMRTPDSDAASQTNNKPEKAFVQLTNDNINSTSSEENITSKKVDNAPTDSNSVTKIQALSLEIPNDNTKPLPRPSTVPSTKCDSSNRSGISLVSSVSNSSPHSPFKRKDSLNSLSPKSPFKRLSLSPVDSIISPKTVHKEIEVLHNLQRDPSPVYVRSGKRQSEVDDKITKSEESLKKEENEKNTATSPLTTSCNWEELDIVDYETLLELRSGNWRLRFQGVNQLEEALRSSENLAAVQPCLASLLRALLSSERNADVADAKHRLLINLITRLPLDNLEERTVQILTGLCRQGGAGANLVCKALMQRLPPAVIVVKLISDEFLHAKSSRFREHALQMVMYALITFPSTCFDTNLCISNAIYAALNRKRRVRQAALDVLAVLGQITTPRTIIEIAQQITATRDEGANLVSAIKVRLARKQLPLITADGSFQYTLRIPSPQSVEDGISREMPLDADIEWITAGIGSVSPTSLKRRAYKHRCSSQQHLFYLPQNNHSNSRQLNNTFKKAPNDFVLNGINASQVQDIENQTSNLQQTSGTNGTCAQQMKKANNEYSMLNNRRMTAKSCSDSSMDGRSSDSTYTNSSGASVGSAVFQSNGTGITGRFTRQSFNSRFPAMDRVDLNTTYLRVHKPPVYYPGMGAYAHLQQQQYNMHSTYPKNYYKMETQHRRQSQQQNHQNYQQVTGKQQTVYQHQQQQTQPSKYHKQAKENFQQFEIQNNELCDDNDNLDGTYTICTGMPTAKTHFTTQQQSERQQQQQVLGNRRFVNVEKFIMQSNKSSQTNGNPNAGDESKQTTPLSVKSTSYSEKSTASAQSANSEHRSDAKEKSVESRATPSSGKRIDEITEPVVCSTPTTTLEGTLNETGENGELGSESPTKWSTGAEVLQLDDVLDVQTDLNRNDSLISLHSKTESINTQLEDTPPALSRTQSNKSIMIEEEIEESCNSFLVVDEEVAEAGEEAEDTGETTDIGLNSVNNAHNSKSQCNSADSFKSQRIISPIMSRPSTQSPTIAELKSLSRRNSMIKSMESLYERGMVNKPDSLDNTTETSSQSSQLNASITTVLPIKPQHTPLKHKSKTTHFLKNTRRISPVKQSIKMSQTELFPSSLAKFEKPREAILKTFDQLDSSSWEVIVQGLKSIVRLMRHHAEQLDHQMHMVCIQLTRSVRNLRSQVSRAACQASTELFTLKLKSVEQECDDLICALLHRTADTNRFLRADATRALESMCDNMPAPKVLNVLSSKGAMHANALVRTTTAKLLHRLVERLGYEKVYNMTRDQRDKFFVTGANFLLEGSLETRSYAKLLFRLLSEHPSYNRLLLEVIPARTYRNVEKTLKNIGR